VIDYGSPVEKDTVLARIDQSVYAALVERARAQMDQAAAGVEQAKAQVASAEANIQRADADLGQMRAKVTQSDRDYERARRLRPTGAMMAADVDSYEAAMRTTKSTLAVGEATLTQTRAALKDAQANVARAKATEADARAALHNAEINLGYCTIKSPVKGVIVDRRVNVGQTVVSSLNAPSLFLIAKDLKRLQVWASVNEADVGNIYSGQPVSFTVDAFPGRVFRGLVAPDQPRLNASMTQNVVTYTVVVSTDNSDGKLLPYLTANLQFEVSKRKNVLMVPNTALRWKPTPQSVVPESRGDYLAATQRGKGSGQNGEKSSATAHNRGMLWIEDGGYVRPVKVQTGVSDGLMTEIVKGDIEEGDGVVIGESRSSDGGSTANPFAPKLFSNKK
jgi:HlyD family secretion protein